MKKKYLVKLGILTIIGVLTSTIMTIHVLPIRSELRNAPEQITINNHDFKLECYLSTWVICLDISPSACSKPRVYIDVNIIDLNSSHFPEEINVNQIWAINKNDIWHFSTSDFTFPDRWHNRFGNILNWRFYDGPYWTKGDLVDIVVQLKYNSQLFLLRVSDQLIYE